MEFILSMRGFGQVTALVLVALLVRFSYKLYTVRTHVRSFQRNNGLPSPPHSFLFGHLPVFAKLMTKYAPDVAGHSTPILLLEEYPELRGQGLVCIDTWPIANPMLAVFHPDMITQFCQNPSMPKSSIMSLIFGDFTECQDLVCSEGSLWKKWRSIFNPSFSNKNVLSLVPAFIEEIQVFRDVLFQLADSKEPFPLMNPALKATCDVIGRAVLGKRMRMQTSESRLYDAMKHQLSLIALPGLELWRRNPIRRSRIWNNNRILREELTPDIRRQVQQIGKNGSPKTICSLAIESHMMENGLGADAGTQDKERLLDKGFMDIAFKQIIIFLIAGHDTTAATLCYVYYCLHRYPDAADRVRKEHEEVLGANSSEAADACARDPSVLHRLPYTTAIIKETLRLYPPIASTRAGSRSLELVNPESGQRFPTEGFSLLSTSQASHRLSEYWEKPHVFIPERWLAKAGEELYPPKNVWRPFEHGPRNCIGQELAMIELKLILILTLRDLDIIPAYDENATQLFGETGYQADVPGELNNRPKDGMPVRIRTRRLCKACQDKI